MNLNALAIALQGFIAPAYPMLIALQGMVEDANTGPTGGSGGKVIGAPWQWVPFNPVRPRRPKKRRHADIVFL